MTEIKPGQLSWSWDSRGAFENNLASRGLTDNGSFVNKFGTCTWGCSSVGRALEWHSRGPGFNSPQLHQRFQVVSDRALTTFLLGVHIVCMGSFSRPTRERQLHLLLPFSGQPTLDALPSSHYSPPPPRPTTDISLREKSKGISSTLQ
jgi:hypothetical protein